MADDAASSHPQPLDASKAFGRRAAKSFGPRLIRQKLSRTTLIVMGITLLVAACVILISDMIGTALQTRDSLASSARVLAGNLSAPVKLKDASGIAMMLEAQLQSDSVSSVAIFQPDGTRLATRDKRPSDTLPAQMVDPTFSGVPQSFDHTDHYEPIAADGVRIGTLLLRNGDSLINMRLPGSLPACIVVFVAGLIGARSLSRRYHAMVSEPLVALAGTARQITTERDFKKRAQKCFDDETGAVAEALNDVCQEVESRGVKLLEQRAEFRAELDRVHAELEEARKELRMELARAHSELEKNVVARTTDLQKQVADRKRAEEEMKDSEMRYRSLFENNPVPMFVVHLETLRFVAVNYAAVGHYGYSMNEFLQFSLCDLTRGTDPKAVMRTFRSKEKSFNAGEWKHAKKDGALIDVQLTAHAIIFGGQIAKIVLANDVTERNRAQRELEDLHKKLLIASRQAGQAEVATGVLHNVGNVLNSVNVSTNVLADSVRKSKAASIRKVADLLEANKGDLPAFFSAGGKGQMVPGYLATLAQQLDTEQEGRLAEIEQLAKNVAHIKDIVAMQQDYAKVTGVMEDFAPRALIDEALRMTGADLQSSSVKVEVACPETLPHVTTDRHKVLQILVNLITNAQQAMDGTPLENRTLAITVAPDSAGHAAIAIRDTGCGIAEENLARVFNHGFTTKPTGHGFGLHSAANAATEIGGSLTGASDGPGRGAVFTLTLPLTMAGTIQKAA